MLAAASRRDCIGGASMTYQELIDFLENRMRMSHIYQPLLIRSLVESDGTATLRQLAVSFVVQDESQLLYYEDRLKKMPLPVLKRHGILDWQGKLVTLNVDRLTYKEKARIKVICEQKIQEFLESRGLATWDYRMLESDPVPDSLRYEVLRRGGGRCALCGATKNDRPLHVDHIIPRSRGGRNTVDNLQVLCDKCNLAKSNRDDTDFRELAASEDTPEYGCPFCAPDRAIFAENDSVFAIKDKFPVTAGHLLIIPKRHTPDYFTMTTHERRDAEELLRVLQTDIKEKDPTVKGFNIGMNCGEAAGQTVMHAHIHLIPRRDGDVENPRGGVRGVIPEMRTYPA